MTSKIRLFTVYLIISVCVLPISCLAASSGNKVYVIPVSGEVSPGMAVFIERAIKDALAERPEVLIFEMDTFGGRVDSALQIVDAVSNISKVKTIAYVSKRAISAGALIALSCNRLVMKNGTTIGDCAPITYTKEGPKMMGEKFQSPLRAKFRALAGKNGYPEALAEAMVTEGMEVYRIEMPDKTVYMDSVEYDDLSPGEKKSILSKKTVVKKGELLTMNDAEAVELGFSKMSVGGFDELVKKMGLETFEIVKMKQQWSETLVRQINTIAPILMMIGMAAVYMEIKAPGFGAPGIVGIICLTLVFFNQYIVGLADYTELIMLLLGLVLLGFEFFVIPGFGIAGIAGFICIIVGMILSFQGFVIPDPSLPWEAALLSKNIIQVLGSCLMAFVISMLLLRYLVPKLSRVISGPYLSTTLEDSHADSKEAEKVRVGDKCVAMTLLRPSGKALIGNDVFDVISDGEFMEKGTAIVISEIQGNRLIVIKDVPK